MKRSEVNQNLTWNLSDIYKTVDDFKKALTEMNDKTNNLLKNYEGKLNNAENINNCLNDLKEILILNDLTSSYAFLGYEVDLGSKEALEIVTEYENISVPVMSKLSFIDTEILENTEETIKEAMKNKENERYLGKILDKKAHTLSKDVEAALSELSPCFDAPYRTYNQSKMQDIKFDDFEVDGKVHSMTYNVFEASYEVDVDTNFRRKAFKEFYKTLEKYENTFASTYYANAQKDKILSKIRNYDNVFEYLLADQEVSIDLYNRQCDVIMEHLAPHIRKYAKLLKRIHKLDKVTFSDMKMPVDAEYTKKFSIDDCKKMVKDGLKVLGEDYASYLDAAFENRYIDYVDNEGKSSGAFCSSPYQVHPYVLLTWTDNMSDVLTVAHELGHGGHFRLSGQNQNIFNVDCSMYFVEAPSTTNELIMAHHLLNNAKDAREKRWIISQIISGTYYHNFVTHFLEAYFQREVFKLVDKGEAIDTQTLNSLFKETMHKFFGDEIELVDGVERTWMRQPHYYIGLYPYTYSASLTIGTQMCLNILENPENAKTWIEVLKAGGSKKPADLAKMAGVDITTDKPLLNTIAYIGSLIDEMIKLTDELEGK